MYIALCVSGTQGNVPERGNTFSISMALSGKDAAVIAIWYAIMMKHNRLRVGRAVRLGSKTGDVRGRTWARNLGERVVVAVSV